MLKQDRIEDRTLSETIIKNSYSAEDTYQIGYQLAANAKPGDVFCLIGDLGVGKTVFSQGFGAGLGIEEPINSPTFTIVQVYDEGRLPFYHFDMYRITGDDDLYSIGYYDYLTECEAGRAVCIVEWSENIPYALPDRYIRVTVSKAITDREKPLDGKNGESEYSDAVFNIRTIKAEAVGK